MKTFFLFAALVCTAFADMATQAALTDVNFELSRLRLQLQSMQQAQAKPAQTYVPGETTEQRSARHTQAVADAEAAYQADWQAKNPLLSSMRAPKFYKQQADAAIAASDAQAAANAQYQAPAQPQRPDPQIAAMQRKIKALEAQVTAQKKVKKK